MEFDTIIDVSSKFEAQCSMTADTGLSLSDYMQLPVDQYVCIKMPLDATLQRMTGNQFNLTVPPVKFFNLEVSPMVLCDVEQSDKTVVIKSENVVLRGAPYVVGLNGCYKINILTTFRWQDTNEKRSITSESRIYVRVDPPPPFKFFPKQVLESTGSLAMNIALRQIENAFVQSLARDYEKWVSDKSYRETRTAGVCEVGEIITQ